MRPKGMKDLAAFSAREVKRAAAEERVFLCKRTVGDKVIPASFLKVEGIGDACWCKRPGREEQIEELVGSQNPGPEAPPNSLKGQERRELRICQERSPAPSLLFHRYHYSENKKQIPLRKYRLTFLAELGNWTFT